MNPGLFNPERKDGVLSAPSFVSYALVCSLTYFMMFEALA